MKVRRIALKGATILAAIAGANLGGAYLYAGAYGVNVVLTGGVSYWKSVQPDDPRISASMRLALSQSPPSAAAGEMAWREVAPGFEVGELPVLAAGGEVDRILLSRFDPAHYAFVARNAPGGKEIETWRRELGAVFVINGSYYARRGDPDTPFLSDGVLLGPPEYEARQGAFVASPSGAALHDLAGEDWQSAFQGATNALVSYPLLVGGKPEDHAIKPTRWLANRSFVGQDSAGRVIFGTTTDAFFSLARLAEFLRAAPLDLTIALNLDGGPVASQAISVLGYQRKFGGQWELMEGEHGLKLLGRLYGGWDRLPVVIAALPK